jgi:hypothetical protein
MYSRIHEVTMRVRRVFFAGFIAVCVIVLSVPFNLSSFAADSLYLRGVVKGINPASRTVTIDVRSSSCRGERTFRADNPGDFVAYTGKAIVFSVDGAVCTGDRAQSNRITNHRLSGEKQ